MPGQVSHRSAFPSVCKFNKLYIKCQDLPYRPPEGPIQWKGRLPLLQAVLRRPVAKQGKPGVSVKTPGAGFSVFGYDFSVFGKISLLRICFREIYSE